MLLRVRSDFRIISISSSTDLNNNKKNKTIKPKAVLLMQSLKKKDNEFQLVLWASSPHIWLVQGHFLFV